MFGEYDHSRHSSHDYRSAAPSLPPPISYPNADASAHHGSPSAPKRRKQSHDTSAPSAPEAPADSSDPTEAKGSSRVAKACQPCSTKKRRCDGRQPECSVCQVLGTPCTYNHTGLKRGPPKGFRSGPKESARAKLVRTLETTIRDLVNHLGKDDAGAEIIRVSGERELQIAGAQPEQNSKASGRAGAKAEQDLRASSRVKIEHLTSSASHPSVTFEDDDDEEDRAVGDEDVIGETRQGELVYRGSSSGIGILQRQHRADSPSPAIAIGASRSAASSSSAPFAARSRDDRGPADAGSHAKAPVFLPITSPRTAGDTETVSSIDKSPRQSKFSPNKDASSVQSLYPGSGHGPTSYASVKDPSVSVEENDRLFRYYWQGFHPFYPILYKPWFVKFSRENLRSNLEPSLLYAIYAIAACVVPGNASSTTSNTSQPPLNLERAHSFCEAAERHVLAKGLRPDIASIQTCWLLSLYSHGTGDLSRAWNFSNLASSMAVDMGLHRWPIYRPEIVQDRVQRETRIRIIWHCYIIDKVLCSEMGRPVTLRAKDIDVPLLSEEEEDEFELWSEQTEMQSAGQTATSTGMQRMLHAPSCLNWGVHLFKIVERILDEVHSLRRKASLRRQGKEQILADLDRQLSAWKDKLPAHLHLDDSTNDGPFPAFFALNLWYYTARLLLHRPFIPQEEGLAMSKVLENDSHRQSTLAANTICDLLEATSRDIVDRLSTDLGYCLFTAAVMFVFNARLPNAKIAADARRRYGLCVQWLKKLADTWPAASAHRMLLDGFAVVGEDASKHGVDPQQRRASVAAIQAANAGTAIGAASKVSNWIAETEGALQDQPSNQSTDRKLNRHSAHQQRQDRAYGANNDTAAQNSNAAAASGDNLAAFADNWDAGADATGNFAPGIFDVESFFWNENAANPSLMGTNFTALPNNMPSGPVLQALQQHQQPQQGMPYNGYNSGMLGGFNQPQGNAPQALPYQSAPFNQHTRSSTVPTTMSMSVNSVAAPAQPMNQPAGQASNNAQAGAADANTGFNTSPFAFQPTAQSLGEFWSMLELPPAFLQQ